MTLEAALAARLEHFATHLRDSLLDGLETRVPYALAFAQSQAGRTLSSDEALHAGYMLALVDVIGALAEGAELIAGEALHVYNEAQN